MPNIRNFDYILLVPVGLLIALGLITLYSLSPVSGDLFLKKQILWVVLGLVAMFFASSIDYRLFRSRGAIVFIFYALSVGALALLFIAGTRIKGVEGWFSFGGFFLQPVEFVKITLLIILAKYFSGRHIEIYHWKHIFISGSYIAIPAFLLMLQPDLGATIVIIGLWIAIMIFVGISRRRLLVLALLLGIISIGAWYGVLAPYQKARMTSFLNPWADSRGSGYHSIQSMIAVGGGKITGAGIGYGTQSHLHFLPEPETDFIFATFAEEWGFIGSVLFFSIFGFFFWRLFFLARAMTNNFATFFIFGYFVLIFIQFTIHVGANTGVLPITGLTLPFMSYGGSSLLALFLGLGIIQSIVMRQNATFEN